MAYESAKKSADRGHPFGDASDIKEAFMNTKYTTGQAVLIPATIRSAEEINGQIIYRVDANVWDGIPENAIIVNENAQTQRAMQTFMDTLLRDDPRR